MEDAFTHYFTRQAGAGRTAADIGPVYERSYSHQNGRGCCGLTGRYISAIATPVLAKGIRALGEEAAAAGFGFYNDMTNAPAPVTLRNVRDAAVSRLAEAGRNLKRRARKTLTGRGRKRKPTTASAKRKPTKKKRKPKKRKPKKSTKARRKRKTTQTGRGRASGQTPHPFDIFS